MLDKDDKCPDEAGPKENKGRPEKGPILTKDEVKIDAGSESLVGDLVARGYRVLAPVEQDSKSRLATIRLVLPGSGEQGVVADVLFAPSGVEAEVVAAAQPLEPASAPSGPSPSPTSSGRSSTHPFGCPLTRAASRLLR